MQGISANRLKSPVFLNLCVPFILVFTQSSQFNPKGYFSYAMLFVFTSLMPPDNTGELLTEILVFWLCVAFRAVCIGVYFRLFSSKDGARFRPGDILGEMSRLILLLTEPEREKEQGLSIPGADGVGAGRAEEV